MNPSLSVLIKRSKTAPRISEKPTKNIIGTLRFQLEKFSAITLCESNFPEPAMAKTKQRLILIISSPLEISLPCVITFLINQDSFKF